MSKGDISKKFKNSSASSKQHFQDGVFGLEEMKMEKETNREKDADLWKKSNLVLYFYLEILKKTSKTDFLKLFQV